MIGAFLDESFDMGKRGVFVVGGILGRGVATFELERRWQKIRSRPDVEIDYFKASQCERGTGEFAKHVKDAKKISSFERQRLDSISHEFLAAIAQGSYDKSYLAVHGVGVVQDHFYDVIKDPQAKAILGDTPYRLGYDLAMMQCAWAMKQLGTGDCVSFVCDENEEHNPVAYQAYRSLKENNPKAAQYMATFAMADEKQCQVLQAADACVFEIRRALNLSLGQWQGSLRKQFGILADTSTMFLITHTKREQLEWIVANHQPGEPYKLDELMEMQQDVNIRLSI